MRFELGFYLREDEHKIWISLAGVTEGFLVSRSVLCIYAIYFNPLYNLIFFKNYYV